MVPGPLTLGIDAGSDAEDREAVARRAITELAGGGAVIVPTDTVYGLAVHPERPGALDHLFTLKGRDRAKPMAVLAADETQAAGVLDLSGCTSAVQTAVATLMEAGWPGALTLVGPRADAWRRIDLGGDPNTIGVRVPDSQVVRAIASAVGPIVTTSANRSGEPTPTSATAAARALGDEVGLVVDAGPCDGLASTVLDITVVPFRMVRRGAFVPVGPGVDSALVEPVEPVGGDDG